MVTTESGVDAPAPHSSLLPAVLWLVAAAVAAIVVPWAIGAAVPVLTFVWLAVAAVALRHDRTPATLGLVRPPGRELLRVTAVTSVAMTVLFGLAEAVTHPYRELLDLVGEESSPDSTFAWVVDDPGIRGLVGFVVYGALVTIFAEEIVFRGVLLSRLRARGAVVAVGGTTLAFALVQALPAALLSPAAAFGFLIVDAVLAVGVVGGLAAYTTRSISPSLLAVTVANVAVLAAVA